MRKNDLEDRLVAFAIQVTEIAEKLPKTYLGKYLGNQIIRSGISPALNYGEARAAESRADFVHKVKVVLKELRETFVCLKIINRKKLIEESLLNPVIQENNELISIFVSSLKTAQSKQLKGK